MSTTIHNFLWNYGGCASFIINLFVLLQSDVPVQKIWVLVSNNLYYFNKTNCYFLLYALEIYIFQICIDAEVVNVIFFIKIYI